ncbi:uncharacterized protein LOC135842099 [Planococcus citri]|uniref:uncharacterized protein LOC135842099 n=1 Tax=Planococcus citri TaxID=170843 RepID=UPI0031F7EF72
MQSIHSTMKSLRSVFVILTIFLFIEETISMTEVFLPRDGIKDPLAVIYKGETLSWELAIPHATDNVNLAGYYYEDDHEKTGRRDYFYIACAASRDEDKEKDVEKRWRATDESFKESIVFRIEDYESANVECTEKSTPSIQKLKLTDSMNNPMYCGKPDAELYEVGFPVLVSDESGVGPIAKFMSLYKICHSKAEGAGTLYTIHQIVSPDLLLLEKRTWSQPLISRAIKSYLDEDLRSVNNFYADTHIYRFVGPYFMPTRIWERTTMFPFNFTPVEHYSIFKGLLRFDKFIQLFSKTNKIPLTVYSGTYEKTVAIPYTEWCGLKKCSEDVSIGLFWRILVDSRDYAIVIVTQLTQIDCDFTENMLCQDDKTRFMLEYYGKGGKGGCMYKCPATDRMIEELGLPATELGLKHKGVLSLRVPKMKPKNQGTGGASDAGAQSHTEYVDVSAFMGDSAAFAAAVIAVDGFGGLASIMDMDSGDAGGGYGHSEGGNNDGPGEGGAGGPGE